MQLNIPFWPHTRLGWWATGIVGTFGVLFIINTVMMAVSSTAQWWMETVLPVYSIVMIISALGGSICGVVAWRYARDVSFAVLITMLPLVGFLLLLVGEFLVPH